LAVQIPLIRKLLNLRHKPLKYKLISRANWRDSRVNARFSLFFAAASET